MTMKASERSISIAEFKRRLAPAWTILSRACQKDGRSFEWLEKALAVAEEQERGHRRMGKRFVPDGKYSVSANDAARYMVLHWVSKPVPEVSYWGDVVSVRQDIAFCHAIRELLPRAAVADVEAYGFGDIDYSTHVSLGAK